MAPSQTQPKREPKGETPLRNVRVVDDLWEDCLLINTELPTNNTAVMVEALQRHREEHQDVLRRVKRRMKREQAQRSRQ